MLGLEKLRGLEGEKWRDLRDCELWRREAPSAQLGSRDSVENRRQE